MQEKFRYFIEPKSAIEAGLPAPLETIKRRQSAMNFLQDFQNWLRDHDMTQQVHTMDITAMGQIQITCTHQIIETLRGHHDVASIRTGLRKQFH